MPQIRMEQKILLRNSIKKKKNVLNEQRWRNSGRSFENPRIYRSTLQMCLTVIFIVDYSYFYLIEWWRVLGGMGGSEKSLHTKNDGNLWNVSSESLCLSQIFSV